MMEFYIKSLYQNRIGTFGGRDTGNEGIATYVGFQAPCDWL